MNTTIKSYWKTISSFTMTANLFLVACGDMQPKPGLEDGVPAESDGPMQPKPGLEDGVPAESDGPGVNGTVKGALSGEDAMAVAVIWQGADDTFVIDGHSVENEERDFHLALPATPPAEALVPIGETTGTSASVTLTKNGKFYAQSDQQILFLSEELGEASEVEADSPLRNATAGYNLAVEDRVIPFDSTIEIHVNSPENCHFRLRSQLEQCEESEGLEAGCYDAHLERVEACAAAG